MAKSTKEGRFDANNSKIGTFLSSGTLGVKRTIEGRLDAKNKKSPMKTNLTYQFLNHAPTGKREKKDNGGTP